MTPMVTASSSTSTTATRGSRSPRSSPAASHSRSERAHPFRVKSSSASAIAAQRAVGFGGDAADDIAGRLRCVHHAGAFARPDRAVLHVVGLPCRNGFGPSGVALLFELVLSAVPLVRESVARDAAGDVGGPLSALGNVE